jgi:hypothetical protein
LELSSSKVTLCCVLVGSWAVVLRFGVAIVEDETPKLVRSCRVDSVLEST